MAAPLVECVPNFSEGRNQATIDAIADAVRASPGCTLLDVDPGKSTNRTVFTFVGSPAATVRGAVNACKVAQKLIDMSVHKGEHPRFGACDVCPFIPVQNTTMADCVECARQFGQLAATELGIPVYLYGNAANAGEHRKLLPQVRQGEYEGLAARITQPEWRPDFGPAEFNPSWGATAAGARKFLIAYNINILGTKEQAHRIALNVRDQGRGPGQEGRLKECKGIGWWVDDYNLAQVSVNLTDPDVTGMHHVYEECKKDAEELKLGTLGTEVVGLVPLASILQAAEFYMQKESLFLIAESDKVRLAVNRLGLAAVAPFDPKTRIIEYVVGQSPTEPLASLSVRQFVQTLGARLPAPGGGSASALTASMGAGLGAMVGWMTYGNRKFESFDGQMRTLIPQLHDGMQALLPCIDADTDAFTGYMTAMKMPKASAEEQAARTEAMQVGLRKAVEVPLTTMRLGDKCWPAMVEMADVGNLASKSDLQVGARSLEVGIWGAYQNVLINLEDIEDKEYCTKISEEAKAIHERAEAATKVVLSKLDQRSVKPAAAVA